MRILHILDHSAPLAPARWMSGRRDLRRVEVPDRLVFMSRHDHNDQYDQLGAEMITRTSAVTFRQNLGEMLNQVQYRHDTVVISKDGKPVAALVDARLFERIRRMQARFDRVCQRIESSYGGVDETEGLAEIDAAVETERAQYRSDAMR